MLEPGNLIQPFSTTRFDGQLFDYRSIWQKRNLVLVSAPESDPGWIGYAEQLVARAPEFQAYATELVITSDPIPAVPFPGVVVADRWGEVFCIKGPHDVAGAPDADELLEWTRFVQHQCPECQGETR
jgi:hypothetical protein